MDGNTQSERRGFQDEPARSQQVESLCSNSCPTSMERLESDWTVPTDGDLSRVASARIALGKHGPVPN